MAVADETARWAEALRRIAACREARSKTLDLQDLLLARTPEELIELGWLQQLNLRGNRIGAEGARALSRLVNLTSLNLQGNGIGAEGAPALSDLMNLTSLNLRDNGIGAKGARALSGLVNLTSLDLRSNRIGAEGAPALSELVNLTSLDLRDNWIRAEGAHALSGLVNLTSLDIWNNEIGAKGVRVLSGLMNLTSLDLGYNQMGVEGARALSGLVNLTSLNIECNQIGTEGARALSGLVNLTSLNLRANGIGTEGARALSGLVNLTSLDLGSNGIRAEGIGALSRLMNLTSLNIENSQIGAEGARALSGLVNLKVLYLSGNGVTDLSPLLSLQKLKQLNCSGCRLQHAPPELWDTPSLESVILYELASVPKEVLSARPDNSCLERLRAHFADLKSDKSDVTDFKLMILGNGRVGKTQICRRLRGEDYDETVPSTHGVKFSSTPLTTPIGPVTLKIWDFGGQDIYHGTHALFLKSRAIFSLVWTPESEAVHEHEHGGFTFRNQPLGYWLAYVRAFGGENSPLIVVQTQCDLPEQEHLRPPVSDDALDAFPFKKVLHYSAKENRGRAALNEALADAVQWLRRQQGETVIGAGRAAVKVRLEQMYAEGKQLISQNDFLALCAETGNVSSPLLLLDYLHNIGAVFYRKGLFGDAIILDQAWVLGAVYAVFDRDSKAFKYIERYGGRFRRSDLTEWVWQKHGIEEQKLFLSFMLQCGICFTLRRGQEDIDAEYIAPDLLPKRHDPVIAVQLRQKWDDWCNAEATLTYELLPPGLMRTLISKIGEEAGFAAEYWRDGFYFYDERTGSRALVEQRYTKDWAGEIHIQTQRGQAEVLLYRLLQFIDESHGVFGARLMGQIMGLPGAGKTTLTRILAPKLKADKVRADNGGDLGLTLIRKSLDTQEHPVAIKPGHEPSAQPEYFVSYAWGDDTPEGHERETVVDKLCDEAERRGITLARDKTVMRCGDRISKFMSRMGRSDRIFIILSDKYLKSAFCMHELFDVWRSCRQEDSEFIAKTRVLILPCAKITTLGERTQYALYWKEKFEETEQLVKRFGPSILAEADLQDHRWTADFVNRTPDILRLVLDILTPRSLDGFAEYGFEAPPA